MKSCFIVIIFLQMFSGIYSQGESIKQVSSEKFRELISENKGVLLDVRTAREYKNGHIPDAGNLNYYALDFRKKLILLPLEQPIFLYCNTGYRSENAAEYLIKNGYTQVYNLQHGIMEWELRNHPLVIEPGANPDTDNNMDPSQYQAIIQSDSLVFFDFYAPWCGPCRKMMPMIDSLIVDYYEEIRIYKINVDASKKLVRELELVGVPYLAILRKGKVLFSNNGAISRQELTKQLDKHIRMQSQIVSQQ
jgi:thioredoxin 1